MRVKNKTAAGELPDEIRALRLRLGLHQHQLAAKLGVSTSAVQKWELGRVRPHPGALQRIRKLQEEEPAKVSEEEREQFHTALDIILSRAPETIIKDIAERLVTRAGRYGFRRSES